MREAEGVLRYEKESVQEDFSCFRRVGSRAQMGGSLGGWRAKGLKRRVLDCLAVNGEHAVGSQRCSGTAHAKGKTEREWEHAVSVAIRLTHST